MRKSSEMQMNSTVCEIPESHQGTSLIGVLNLASWFNHSKSQSHKVLPIIIFLASPAARSSAQIETEAPTGRLLKVKYC